MSYKIAAVTMDTTKIPYVNGSETIFTLGKQKVWYTSNTVPIEIPNRIKWIDLAINSFLEKFFKKSDKRDLLTINYFARQAAKRLRKGHYDEVIFENQHLKNKILNQFKEKEAYGVKVSLA